MVTVAPLLRERCARRTPAFGMAVVSHWMIAWMGSDADLAALRRTRSALDGRVDHLEAAVTP